MAEPLGTKGLTGAQALRRWQTLLDEVAGIDLFAPQSIGDFRGSLGHAMIGQSVLLEMRSEGAVYSVERGKKRIARDNVEICGIATTLSGRGTFRSWREFDYGSGDMTFIRGDVPMSRSVAPESHDLVFLVPSPILQSFAASPATLLREPHRIPPSPMRNLVFDYFRAVSIHGPELSAAEGERAMSLGLELLVSLLTPGAQTDHQPAVRAALKQRILRSIDRAIANPALGPRLLAERHHLSIRYLHALFEDGESVGRTILHRRLDLCRAMLASREGGRLTVAETAYRHGFVSVPHFSRAFKARFGMTPGDVKHSR